MTVSPNTQAVLLLTSRFSSAKGEVVKPLTPKEWGRFAVWMKERSLTPEKLMRGRADELLQGWSDKSVTIQRIEALLERGSALALAMEKWLRAGLWVLTRSDPTYPHRLKLRLGIDSPALLFGCGSQSLLNSGGLAVVGSRNTSKGDLEYSRKLGAKAAADGESIVSGGARGVDEAAMLGALEADGTVIGILANGLLRACSSVKYRSHLMKNNLVLISPFYPDAGFNVGNAMARNKYIYSLADAAMVVHSGASGGAWTGAKKNLRKQWVPLWVKETNDKTAGNAAIVEAGGNWVSGDIDAIDFSAFFVVGAPPATNKNDLFGSQREKEPQRSQALPETDESPHHGVMPEVESATEIKPVQVTQVREVDAADRSKTAACEQLDFYALFL
jgi:predicted Rossmann fold nucleotide-binding protein DprA/Smf involved in DNA uptake